jgi:hypothetical protein
MERRTDDHLAADVERPLERVGRDWIEQRVAEVHTFEEANERSGGRRTGMRSFHPLAVSAARYLAAEDVGTAHQSMGDGLVRLAMLGGAVRVLDGVFGLTDRIANLVAGDAALYYATEFELLSAGLYAATGHRVQFVEEADTPTFDLLVDGEVEVECKQVTPVTQRERHAADLWSLLDRRLRRVLDQHDGVFFVYATVPDLPERSHVDEVVDKVLRLLEAGTAEAHESRGAVRLRYARTVARRDRRGISGDIPRWFPDRSQHLKVELSMALDGSAVEAGRGGALAFDGRTPPPDPARVAREQVRKAPRQFTGERPAVVHVDIASALRRAHLQLGDTTVGLTIRSWLRRHPEITAANILCPPSEGSELPLTFHLERNPAPNHGLPNPFLGVDWAMLPPPGQ